MNSIFDTNNKEVIIFKKTNSLYSMFFPEKDLEFGVLITPKAKFQSLDKQNPASYLNICQKIKVSGVVFDFVKREIISSDIEKIRREFKLLDLRSFRHEDYSSFSID